MGNQLRHISIRLTLPVLLLLVASIASADKIAIDNANCGIISGQLHGGVNSYGYLDYTDPADQAKLARANSAYFSAAVRNQLANPRKSALYASKTLRISPNHHNALYTMMRYYKQQPRVRNERDLYTMQCFFTRANFFRPNDAMVYMLNGLYYHWDSDWIKTEEKYLQAYELRPNDPQINYNLGLMYFDKGDYESAAKHARVAYDRGHPLDGLRNLLKDVNTPID